jgi:hypothetical protein
VSAEDVLWHALGATGRFAFRLTQHDGKRVTAWPPARDRRWFLDICRDFGWAGDLVLAARPYLDRGSFRLLADSACVWARCETGKQVRALEAFDVEPTLVLRDGSTVRHTAFWALTRRLPFEDGVKVNRHLAHKLGTAKKHAEQLWFRPPGSIDRSGSRAVPIVHAGGSGEDYAVGRVCRTLPRTLPDPDAWRGGSAVAR